MGKQSELDKAFDRLLRRFPPKFPDRTKMRDFEKDRLRTNRAPVVQTNGYQSNKPTGEVDWNKQERIPVGHVASEGGRRKKPDGSKNKKKGA